MTTTWRQIANPQLGSWPLDDAVLADWDAGRAWRAQSPDRKLALKMRLELVAAGSRGSVDLDGFGPWNATQKRGDLGRRLTSWKRDGYDLLFNIDWTNDPRLLQTPNWLGYWNFDRIRHYVQHQSFVMNVANPDYQRWVVPRVVRAFETSGADALHVGVKWDRFELPTARLTVPGGELDVRTNTVKPPIVGATSWPSDIITSSATPGFSDGMRAILRACGVPFTTQLQLLPEPPKTVFTKAEYDAACLAWVGDLAPLWRGNL